MKANLQLALLLLGGCLGGCEGNGVAGVLMQVSATDVPATFLGGTNVPVLGGTEGFAGVPGRHYEAWAIEGDGKLTRFIRFVIVPANEELKARDGLVPDAENIGVGRDWEDGTFFGYVNTQCIIGPCGGFRILSPELLGAATEVIITRQDDDIESTAPSDDVFMRGPVQPWARGSLRGSLVGPDLAPVPNIEISIDPWKDEAQGWL